MRHPLSNNKLVETLESVHDRDSFLIFVQALIEDRRNDITAETKQPSTPYAASAYGWENTTIEDYLAAAVAWADTSLEESPSWHTFAAFLYCGKIYE